MTMTDSSTRQNTPPSLQRRLNTHGGSLPGAMEWRRLIQELFTVDISPLLENLYGPQSKIVTTPSSVPGGPQGTFVLGNSFPKKDFVDRLESQFRSSSNVEFGSISWNRTLLDNELWTESTSANSARSKLLASVVSPRLLNSDDFNIEGLTIQRDNDGYSFVEMVVSAQRSEQNSTAELSHRLDSITGLTTITHPTNLTVPVVSLQRAIRGSGLHRTVEDYYELDIPSYAHHDCVFLSTQIIPYGFFIDPDGIQRDANLENPFSTVVPFASNIEWPNMNSPSAVAINVMPIISNESLTSSIFSETPVKIRVPFDDYTSFQHLGKSYTALPLPSLHTDCFDNNDRFHGTGGLLEGFKNVVPFDDSMVRFMSRLRPVHYILKPEPTYSSSDKLSTDASLQSYLLASYPVMPEVHCWWNAVPMIFVLMLNVVTFRSMWPSNLRGKKKAD
eukprot:GHVH01003111.1.p1 GENE.GHVH01003111.1~~GHVH01003111.1.p1  ORF type:complete len:446 (+),score=39.09 GHVH01003111.1:237-1574(+)